MVALASGGECFLGSVGHLNKKMLAQGFETGILPVGPTSQIVSRLWCFGYSDETRWLPSVREGDAVHWKSM